MLRLVVGNLNYSSWSVRAWLALKWASADFRLHDVGLKTETDWKDRILAFSGAGKVPVLVDGALSVHESLAICEYVAELYPAAELWPADRQLRARGRAIACEMLSGFAALRSAMPMNLRGRARTPPTEPAVEADVARLLDIWQASLASGGGPFLLGAFSIADCMYFPVAARFRTYGVVVPEWAQEYSQRLFELAQVRELEALASQTGTIEEYESALG
ncbi:MAG TPA: glutathione S-transferase [Polyangiaceae bacterium]|nr:glutathione S-transferase [Polyangiaceae bacterium]